MTGRSVWGWVAGAVLVLAGVWGVLRRTDEAARPSPVSPGGSAPERFGRELELQRQALARREAELDARQETLAERERAAARGATAAARPPAAEGTAAPPPAPEGPKGPEDPLRAEVLAAASRIGSAMKPLLEAEDPNALSEEAQMQAALELLSAVAALQKHRAGIQGELGADATAALFDALMPEGLRASPDQKARFRQAWLDGERELDLFGIPRHALFENGLGGPGLPPEQALRVQEARDRLAQQAQAILTPAQAAHLDQMQSNLPGGALSIRVGNPGGEEAPGAP